MLKEYLNLFFVWAEGAAALKNLKMNEISVDGLGDPEAAAEGVTLKLWQYDELKNEADKKKVPAVKLYASGHPEE